jgi:flagella basal body P-ring formation protein FlgA
VTVTVRAMSEVSGETFALGQIAEVTGTDRTLKERVAAVEVGASPLPGLTRPLRYGDILIRLRAGRIDPKQIQLICPDEVRVMRGGDEIPPDEMTQAAKAALQAARKDASDEYSFEAAPLTTKLFTPPGKREYRAGIPRGQFENGAAIVPVAVLVDGKTVKTVDIFFRIRRMVTAVVCARLLDEGTVLTEGDVTVARVELPFGAAAPLTDVQTAVGKRTRRRIPQGQPLIASALEIPPVITAGAKVSVESVVGIVKVTAAGVARESGAVGDRIRVFIPQTKKEVTAIIVDASTVRVEVE